MATGSFSVCSGLEDSSCLSLHSATSGRTGPPAYSWAWVQVRPAESVQLAPEVLQATLAWPRAIRTRGTGRGCPHVVTLRRPLPDVCLGVLAEDRVTQPVPLLAAVAMVACAAASCPAAASQTKLPCSLLEVGSQLQTLQAPLAACTSGALSPSLCDLVCHQTRQVRPVPVLGLWLPSRPLSSFSPPCPGPLLLGTARQPLLGGWKEPPHPCQGPGTTRVVLPTSRRQARSGPSGLPYHWVSGRIRQGLQLRPGKSGLPGGRAALSPQVQQPRGGPWRRELGAHLCKAGP